MLCCQFSCYVDLCEGTLAYFAEDFEISLQVEWSCEAVDCIFEFYTLNLQKYRKLHFEPSQLLIILK